MPEHLYALLLVFLEMTFIFIALALLFQQRRRIGDTPFLLALGMLLLLANFIAAADIQGVLVGSLSFSVGRIALFLPLLTAYLMIYIVSGTLHAQRIIIGVAVIYGLSYYLGRLTQLQCNWLGFSLSAGISGATLDLLLNSNRMLVNMIALTILFDLFWVPIFYTRMLLLKIPRIVCIWGALFSAQLVNLLPGMLLRLGTGGEIQILNGEFCARLIANLWLGTLLALYLKQMENENSFPRKSPLDLVFSFFGSYGRSMQLEKNLKEWENRYQLILENSEECILLADSTGRITDANLASRKLLGRRSDLIGTDLFGHFSDFNPPLPAKPPPNGVLHFRCSAVLGDGNSAVLLCSLSPFRLRDENMRVLIGRDVTEETRLNQEKAKLSEQLIHSQRLESLGMLAGGIAHDFNNFIHAILGHVDVAMMTLDKKSSPKLNDHLEKVIMIAEKAGKLTSQLLGFARRGKYNETPVDIENLLNSSLNLIGPPKLREVTVGVTVQPGKWTVSADFVQLQQVMVNLILNALYAMENNPGDRVLELQAGSAEAMTPPAAPPPDRGSIDPARFVRIIVGDNGCGMDSRTLQKIFEPFFTTKPVGVGTGMGLAMVYGTIGNHGGWINVESKEGKGTRFHLFLPKLALPEEEPKEEEHA